MSLKKDYLERAFSIMSEKSSLYQSSSFWEEACRKISNNVNNNGLENFRSEISNLHFFVPTYGFPGNSFSKEDIKKTLSLFHEDASKKNYLSLEKYLNGEILATSDYKIFKSSNDRNDKLDLLDFSESSFGNPIEQFSIEDNNYSRSSLNYLLGLSFLKSILPDFVPKTVLEIGGGFGTLGEILHQVPKHDIKYIDIDLPPIFLIASEYIRNACSLRENDYKLSELNDDIETINIDELPRFSFLPSWEIERLNGKIDLFVNFISFQEMEPDIVKNYLEIVSSLDTEVILLRNMKEGKQKASKDRVGVISPVTGSDYADFLPDFDQIGSNILPFGYTTVDNFNSELLVFKRK
jgi:putative sugar O-methyltransferase|tara:strand:+ start:2358 stop:3410 length:1053 start_codon:yes stop_codon:yes gene_type:complete